jgi:XTP/dITP diphosphohydrolase
MPNPLLFVTSNANKVREAREILGVPIEQYALELEELQSMDLDLIIRHKLADAYRQLRQPVLVEDSGVYLDDWGGFPGPFIKHLKDTLGYDRLTELVGPTRRVHWRVKAGYTDGTRVLIGSGLIVGTVPRSARGTGWGFDAYFVPDGSERTYAQMQPEEKHTVSARSQALRDLHRQLLPASPHMD